MKKIIDKYKSCDAPGNLADSADELIKGWIEGKITV